MKKLLFVLAIVFASCSVTHKIDIDNIDLDDPLMIVVATNDTVWNNLPAQEVGVVNKKRAYSVIVMEQPYSVGDTIVMMYE